MKLYGIKYSSLKSQLQLTVLALAAVLLFFAPYLKHS